MHAPSLSATRTFLGQWSRRKVLATRADRRLARSELATLEEHVAEVRGLLGSVGAFEMSDELRGYAARFEALASRVLREALALRDAPRDRWRQLQQQAQELNRQYADTRIELLDSPAH